MAYEEELAERIRAELSGEEVTVATARPLRSQRLSRGVRGEEMGHRDPVFGVGLDVDANQ